MAAQSDASPFSGGGKRWCPCSREKSHRQTCRCLHADAISAILTWSPNCQLTSHGELLDLANVCFTLGGYAPPQSRLELMVRREEPADGGCQGEAAIRELVEDRVLGVEIVHLLKRQRFSN